MSREGSFNENDIRFNSRILDKIYKHRDRWGYQLIASLHEVSEIVNAINHTWILLDDISKFL